jgi:hypothetical protein
MGKQMARKPEKELDVIKKFCKTPEAQLSFVRSLLDPLGGSDPVLRERALAAMLIAWVNFARRIAGHEKWTMEDGPFWPVSNLERQLHQQLLDDAFVRAGLGVRDVDDPKNGKGIKEGGVNE